MKITLKLVTALVAAASTSACMQGGTLEKPEPMRFVATPDGCVVGAGTAGTSADAAFTYAGKYCRDAHGQFREINADGTFGPTVAGQALVAIAGTVPAAMVNGVAGYQIARVKNRASSGPAVVNLVTAQAAADQQTGVGVDVSIASSLPCATQGTCTGFGH